jgi:hypothetical protein
MFLENNYICFSSKLLINSISKYKTIMTKFINAFITLNKTNYKDYNLLISDSIIYSKYYLYYKTKNCIYSEEIMNIINDVDFYLIKNH